MLVTILLVSLASAASNEIGEECNTCIKVNEICHNVTYLFDLKAPFRNTVVITEMGILRSKNTLYFTFEPTFDDPEYYKLGYVNLDSPETYGVVSGSKPVTNLGTFDIDQDNSIIYLGGSDAIYVLDSRNDKVVFFSSGGDTIRRIIFKGKVFFVREGENKIVEKNSDEFKTYQEYTNVKNFVIDKDNHLVFLNTTGLYVSRFRSNDTVYLSKNAFFRGLTIDLDGAVYAWWVDGIYKVYIETDLSDSRVVRVAEVSSIGALTFDNDNNFLFNSGKGLFRLTSINSTLC